MVGNGADAVRQRVGDWEWQSNEDCSGKGGTGRRPVRSIADSIKAGIHLTALARVDTEILICATHSAPSAQVPS